MARHRPRSAQRRPARARHPVRLPALRPARRRHDRQRHHVSRPLRRARSRQGAGLRSSHRSTRLASLVRAWEWKDPEPTRRDASSATPASTSTIRASANSSSCTCGMQDLPRHLGQHSGGMVICQGQLDSIVPLEPATMPGRVVVQWDKDDCADMGIIKVDLLGLGMMAVLEDSINLIRDHCGEEVDLAHLPADDPAGLRRAAEGRHGRHVPGGKPRADGHACRACGRNSSTTSSCRWRSSGPVRSSARWCIRI